MRKREDGFTIVELMIATAVFSLVLLLCSFAIIHVGRMYYKGMITNRTQDVSRKVTDDIARAIQFGGSGDGFWREGSNTFANAGEVRALCLGSVRYSFSTERALGSDLPALPHVLWKDRIPVGGPCSPLDISQQDPGGIDGVELLGENMRVPVLDVPPPTGAIWDITVRIVYGQDEDLFEDGDVFSLCKGVNASGQFCAVSAFKTSVAKRL